jgi:hypothetical protein
MVGGEADDKTSDLEAEGLVKVFRDVGVGPEFCWVEVLVWGLRGNGGEGGYFFRLLGRRRFGLLSSVEKRCGRRTRKLVLSL